MATYRCFRIDNSGKIDGNHSFEARDDVMAVKICGDFIKMKGWLRYEVWSDRMLFKSYDDK